MTVEQITKVRFISATGLEPVDDDLERCNCPKAGTVGHFCCGWNEQRNAPQFLCGPGRLSDASRAKLTRGEEQPR